MTGHTEADHLIHFALSFPAGGALPHSRPLYKLYLWPYTHVKRRTHVLRAHDFRCPIWAPLDPKHIIEHSFGNSLYIRTFELHLFSFFLLCTLSVFDCFKRLADAAARLQVMQLSQYNAAGFSDTLCEKIMEKLLVSLREQYDYIIIDCGLKHELLTINALAAADYCIIPVQAHFLASEGIPDVLEMVKNVQNRFNPDLKIAGILLTMYQSRPQLCQSVRNSVNDIYGESLHVFERPIEQTIKVAECPAAGMSILDYAPKNPAAESYRSLALEVLHLA